MIRLKDLLLEIGEATAEPFKFVKSSSNEKQTSYSFKTDSNLEYVAEFDLIDYAAVQGNTYEFSFKTESGGYTDTTNKGEIARIMSTLVKILLDFINANKLKFHIMIDPAKVDEKDNRRGKLYQLYVKKNLPSGYNFKIVDGDNILLSPNN
jgi:hypothetical protein